MFEIGVDGRSGSNGAVTVRADHPGATMFKRRAIKRAGTSGAYEVCWLVVRVADVSVYVDENGNVTVSDQDLMP